ncbi:hypothetical protein [Stenotrophomonas sp. GD03958]|uniref:hypothetical protein n=1 Tax=Stenotrophomonas sp. GD03958 TaxID=2975411 RepID=UPI00244B87A8|nr:hypothetical protein [Stenotrophomonas sp. GD03958]MDH1192568.1 hypothetical protein [Stenotrophomonas sp. GD03958]
MNAVEQHLEQWYAEIGRFSVAMGEIEWAVWEFQELLNVPGRKKKKRFADQIEHLKEAVAHRSGEVELKIAALAEEADRLRDVRNSVLHSGVRVLTGFEEYPDDSDIDVDRDFNAATLKLRFASFIDDMDKPDVRIGLDELKEHAASAMRLRWDMVLAVLTLQSGLMEQRWRQKRERKKDPRGLPTG